MMSSTLVIDLTSVGRMYLSRSLDISSVIAKLLDWLKDKEAAGPYSIVAFLCNGRAR